MMIQTLPDYPGRWVVMAEWFGVIIPVFESDPKYDPWIQIQNCISFVKEMGEIRSKTSN